MIFHGDKDYHHRTKRTDSEALLGNVRTERSVTLNEGVSYDAAPISQEAQRIQAAFRIQKQMGEVATGDVKPE